jgi:predicted RNA-binding protein with PUA-like domain
LINNNGVIFNSYLEVVNVNVCKDGYVIINMFGSDRKINLRRLIYLALYEVSTINDLKNKINDIEFFTACKYLAVKSGVIMQFKNPIYYKPGFRYIPNHTRYAIDIDCNVIDTVTNKIVTERKTTQYEDVYLYSPDRNSNKNIKAHRLLAFAWLYNTDFINKPIINHIDGNKHNNKLTNLEWCSYKENCNHALDTGLNLSQIKMMSRDIKNGQVVIYRSGAHLSKVLGMTNVTPKNYTDRLPGYLYKGRYEIKFFDDKSPWYYEKIDDSFKYSKPIITITVINKNTGSIEKFYNTQKFRNKYKLYGSGNKIRLSSIDFLIERFHEKYKNHDVSYIRNSISGPYYVINVINKQLDIFNSMIEVSKHTGRNKSEIQIDLTRGHKYIYDKKWIIVLNPKSNITEYVDKLKPYYNICVTDVSDNTKTIIPSISRVSLTYKITQRTISRLIKNGKTYKGLTFRQMD